MRNKNHSTLPTYRSAGFLLSFIFLMLYSFCLSAQTSLNEAEATALRKMVKAQAENTKTISSSFTQYKHLEFLSNDITSYGKLAFKAPDLVKWEYTKPFTYSVVFKNQTLFINDDGNKSNMDLGSNKVFKQLNQLITSSIRGDMFDEQQFNISYFKKEGKNEVHFVPKDEKFVEFIAAFHIIFSSTGEVNEVKMVEPSGDYTQIIFSDRSLNQSLSDADFSQ